MRLLICTACGVQQHVDGNTDTLCPICIDERQFVPETGQQWTTHEELARNHRVGWREELPDIWSLRIEPTFGIGQRAFLIRTPGGNLLWDCISLLDNETVTRIRELGGLAAVAISHPHFYSVMADWGTAFDVPVYVHEADQEWIQQPHETIRTWSGRSMELLPETTIVRCGGHFAGSSVLQVAGCNSGLGALFVGDTMQVVPDRRVSFMRSYPNLIPLNAGRVDRIVSAVAPLRFDAIFGAFDGRTIRSGAKEAVEHSGRRYIEAISPQVEQSQ